MINYTEQINLWLNNISQAYNLHPLALNAAGVCALRYGQRVECVIECPGDGQVVYFYAPMMKIPAEQAEKFYRVCLKANLFCLETHGATFAIDEKNQQIVLCYPQPTVLLDEQLFRNVLSNFLEIAAQWVDRLPTS